nr:MAG TPA: Conjugal transfer protein [Caudoviricetes sp.]
MKKLHISGKRKALGALLASLIIGVSSTAALAEEAGDLSVFDENDAELSILEESSFMRKQLARMLQGKKNFKEADYDDAVQSVDRTEPKTNKPAVYSATEIDKSQTIPVSSISNDEQEPELVLDSFSRSVQKPLKSVGIYRRSTVETADNDNSSEVSLGRRFLERYYASIGRSYSDTARQVDKIFQDQENVSESEKKPFEGKSLGNRFLKRYEEAMKPQEPIILGDSTLSDYPQRSLDCQYLDYESGGSNIIFVKPGFKTDILLPAGDKLQRITCGDRQRFDIKTYYDKSDLRWHVYVQPYQHDVTTNIIISTDRHTFQAKLETTELLKPFVRWDVPDDVYAGYKDRNVVMDVENVKDLNFDYDHNGKLSAAWAPLNVFDDKHWNTYLSFEKNILQRINPVILGKSEDGTMVIVPYEKRGDIIVMNKVYSEFDVRVGDHITNYVRTAR